jgi:hypothetical protein
MNVNPEKVREFCAALRLGDEAQAALLAFDLTCYEDLVKNCVMPEVAYNDLVVLADMIEEKLAHLPNAGVNEAWNVWIPQIVGLVLSFMEPYAKEHEDNGNPDRQSEQQSTTQDPSGA